MLACVAECGALFSFLKLQINHFCSLRSPNYLLNECYCLVITSFLTLFLDMAPGFHMETAVEASHNFFFRSLYMRYNARSQGEHPFLRRVQRLAHDVFYLYATCDSVYYFFALYFAHI